MAVDNNKLAFSSNFRYPRVVLRGNFTSGSTGGTPVTVAHGLGYIPMVRAAAEYSDGDYGTVSNAGETPYGNAGAAMSIFVTADANNVEFTIFDNTFGGDTVTVYYKVYAEEVT